MSLNRRQFLKATGALGLSASAYHPLPLALAADTRDYKALVCVFLYGGIDSHDLVLPLDTAHYERIANIRKSLFSVQGAARSRSALLPLHSDGGDFGGRQFALASEMPGLQRLFERGEMAVVGNVGPLVEPTTRQSFESGSVVLPPKLFSHNDQQNTWQANSPEGAFNGWGGRFGDAMLASGANSDPVFTAISAWGNAVFLNGQATQPFSVMGEAGSTIGLMGLADEFPELQQVLEAHFRGGAASSDHPIAADLADKMRGAYDSNARYTRVRAGAVPLATAFPESELGRQLRSVANAIAVRGSLGVNRQVFFVGLGGFDTHSAQAATLPGLLSQMDAAIVAFQAAMTELGLADSVTLFTASDFGRTLAINGDGTDHGWGGHQLVIGGAVRGKQIYGDLPPPVLGHEFDAGGGRLIPSVAVEQYAATLGRWFGLSEVELDTALPGLSGFSRRDLQFMV